MKNLLRFVKVYHFVLLFMVIESLSLYIFFNNNDLHRSKLMLFTQEYTSRIYKYYDNVKSYMKLKEENKILIKENADLHSKMSKYSINQKETYEEYIPLLDIQFQNLRNKYSTICNNRFDTDFFKNIIDTTQLFDYIPARIINNSISNANNYIVIDKGSLDGVTTGMGIRVNNGIIGKIQSVSDNYSKAISILNNRDKIGVMVKDYNENNIKWQNGKLEWSPINNNYMTASIKYIPNDANIRKGDTVITNSYSKIYPEGIAIGEITSFTKKSNKDFYDIEIRFFNDMNSVKNVYIIKPLEKIDY